MLFRVIAAVASVAFVAQGALAQLTVQQVVDNINIVTKVSGDANDALSRISPSTSPNEIRLVAQNLASDFNVIIQDLGIDITAMQATPPFTDCTLTLPIIESLRGFVLVHQKLLATVIGKHSIFAQFALTAPIAGVLRTLEATIDKFAFSMINMIPCAKPDVEDDQSQLDDSVGKTIKRYQQFCIPSPLYPSIQPICL
ncbi:hypothetical protein BJY52DRAFT_1378299 [Lactarius psammicola]|nr:hypothetical protein BJY52DRAFT_1378299 [Lactarius psammicola]